MNRSIVPCHYFAVSKVGREPWGNKISVKHFNSAEQIVLKKVAILGVGLLGGSFGLAIRSKFPNAVVAGYSRSPQSREIAIKIGAIQEASSNPKLVCESANLVVVATPVDSIASMVIDASKWLDSDALIMDLGSTKKLIVESIESDSFASKLFVGAHPIAGGENAGAMHAKPDLFRQRTVILTPTPITDSRKLDQARQIWNLFESLIVEMTPEEHDDVFASISHVPHIIAAAMANMLPDNRQYLVGDGWLSTTRIASGDPAMWTAISLANQKAILKSLDSFTGELSEFYDAISEGDPGRIFEIFQRAKGCRDRALGIYNVRNQTTGT
jgi:prephenate dehydrogenase